MIKFLQMLSHRTDPGIFKGGDGRSSVDSLFKKKGSNHLDEAICISPKRRSWTPPSDLHATSTAHGLLSRLVMIISHT